MTKQPTLNRLQLLILLSLVAMSAISTDLYLSGLPQMVEDFSSTTSQVQLTLSLFLFGLAIGQMIAGPLSDQYGRIPVLKIGLGVYVAASTACVFAPNIVTAATTGVLAGYFYNDSVIPMTLIIAVCAVLGAAAWYVLLFQTGEWESKNAKRTTE